MKSQIFQNPYDSKVRKTVAKNRQNALQHKVTTLFAHKPFFERWHTFSTVCTLVTYLCNLFSPMMAMVVVFFVVFDTLSPIVGDGCGGGVALVMAMAVVASLEILKRHSTNNALVYWFNYKKISLGMGLALLCSALSIASSFYGAKTAPQRFYQSPSEQPPQLENLALISQDFDKLSTAKTKQIEDTKKQLAEYKKNHTSQRTGNLSSGKNVRSNYAKIGDNLSTLQKELSTLHSQKITATATATAINENRTNQANTDFKNEIQKHHDKMDGDGLILGYVTLILEAVFWLCFVFIIYYYKRCETEFQTTTAIPIQTAPTPQNTIPSQRSETTQTTNPIGFFKGSNQLYNGFDVVDVDGIRCIRYKNKLYPKESIKNNIYANKTKLKKYTDLDDDDKVKRYTKHLERWQKFLEIVQSVP